MYVQTVFPFFWFALYQYLLAEQQSVAEKKGVFGTGGYGCFRIAMYLMPEAAQELGWIFLILTGISVVYGAFSLVYRQT